MSANSAWNLANFRARLIRDLVAAGYRVVTLATDDGHADAVRALGAGFMSIAVDSSGLSPVRDARLFLQYSGILRRLRPDFYLGFTVKPNIYGSLAASLLGIPVLNNISGLGTAFIRSGPLTFLVERLYRLALRRSAKVFFQNPQDMQLFLDRRLVRGGQEQLIPGSGVDLDRFRPSAARGGDGGFRFLFVGRLLWDKGIGEYAEAARLLRPGWPDVRFQLLGFAGADNRSAVPREEIERWAREDSLEYLGDTPDVRPFLENADCVVLPSYREGLPRSLLEASAMARPMIAADVPGCREVVVEGETGFLCEARSARSLADALERMLRLPAEERARMGAAARARAERMFDEALVSRAYLEALAR